MVSNNNLLALEQLTMGNHDAERSGRLVRWVTDGLGRLLKRIHRQRQMSGIKATKRTCLTGIPRLSSEGTTVLEEVREIIHMPSFKGEDAMDADEVILDGRVSKQLEVYVATIASMCT